MILSSIGIIASGGKATLFDADYQKILTLSNAAGYTLPSASQQIEQNDLVLALKASGIWAKLDTFALFFNDGSANFGLVDWIRTASTNTLVTYTAINSPTWSSNGGFQGNGTSSYISTNLNSASSGLLFSQNNASFFSWIDNIISGNNIVGAASGTRNKITANNFAFTQAITSLNSMNSAADMSGAGYKAIHRSSSTAIELFNNTTQYSRTQTSSTEGGVFLLLRDSSSYMNARTRFFAAGASLVSENTAFYNALNTYFS
jgi:hypothetical protein